MPSPSRGGAGALRVVANAYAHALALAHFAVAQNAEPTRCQWSTARVVAHAPTVAVMLQAFAQSHVAANIRPHAAFDVRVRSPQWRDRTFEVVIRQDDDYALMVREGDILRLPGGHRLRVTGTYSVHKFTAFLVEASHDKWADCKEKMTAGGAGSRYRNLKSIYSRCAPRHVAVIEGFPHMAWQSPHPAPWRRSRAAH
jgi:hypothetical protein